MILLSSMLLTMIRDASSIKDGAIVIRNGLIEDLGPSDRIMQKYPRQSVHRFEDAVLLPGLVNVHAHLELPSLLESVRARTFPGWIRNLVIAKRSIENRQYKDAARRNAGFLVSTGTTTVGEICTHGMSPGILGKSGLRCVIYREIIGMNPSIRALKIPCPSTHPTSLVRYGISPHSPYTVSSTLLQHIKKLSTRRKLRLAMHIAESVDEGRLLQRKKSGLERLYDAAQWELAWAPLGASPVAYLMDQGVLGPNFLAVHAVQVSSSDIDILRRSRTPVAHCPRSNNETGVGKMPLKELLTAGITVGLGTDSLASSPSLSMWDEMRYAYEVHRRSGISAENILRIATAGGAQALGFGGALGGLAPGQKADIIAVPLPSRNTGNIYSDLLRETKTCIMSMVNGKVLFQR
jgi:cytosine/adenosine deaminase-related metal-dependent hydrolase